MNLKINTSMFQPQKKSALCIYMGPTSLQITYLKYTPKGIIVEKNISKEINKKEITGYTIREILNKENILETSATTTIPEELTMLRRFTMPLVPVQDRPTAIKFEAKKHIPFNIEEIVSSFHIIKEDRIKNQMEVLFVAAKKEDINIVQSIIHDAGLTIERIEPSSLALINSLLITGALEDTTKPTAILYFSTNTQATVIISENGIPYIKREIHLSGKEKFEDNLISEIRLSLSYYKREFPEKNINKIIVCGLREKPAWIELIKSNLNISTIYFTPLQKLAGIDLPNPQMEIPIGLSGITLIKSKINLNLFTETTPYAQIDIKPIAIGAITIAIGFLLILYLAQIPSLYKSKKEISLWESKKLSAPELGLATKPIEELNTLKTTFQQKRDILLTYTKNRINWHEKLLKLIQLVPKEIWIRQLTIGDSGGIPGARLLILKGSTYAPDMNTEIEITNNFANTLKNDATFMKNFKRLNLGTINKSVINSYEISDFDLSLTND